MKQFEPSFKDEAQVMKIGNYSNCTNNNNNNDNRKTITLNLKLLLL